MPNSTTTEALYARFRASSGLSTDSRQLQAGQIFLALRGPNFNGNEYAERALAQGATCVVVDDAALAAQLPPDRVALVADCLESLQALARHHRRHLQVPVLGIGGSNGKTTTKELLHTVLNQLHSPLRPAFATPGNLNNHIGVPLSLLQMTAAHRFAVLELGDNAPGEVAALCRVAEPDFGLVTNVGLDHMGGFGSMAANAATKLELFDYLAAHRGHAFVNLDDEAVAAYDRHSLKHTDYGRGSDYQIRLLQARIDGLRFSIQAPGWGVREFHSLLYGAYNLENFLAVATVCAHLDVPPEVVATGFAAYRPQNLRSQVVKQEGRTLILDAYNANPTSVAAALHDFIRLAEPGPKAVVLGDMLELGGASADEHRKLGRVLAQQAAFRVVLVGAEMQYAADALSEAKHPDVHWFARAEQAANALPALLAGMRLVLAKGSRGLALERLLGAAASH